MTNYGSCRNRHSINVGLTLAHSGRRRTKFKTTLIRRVVSAGYPVNRVQKIYKMRKIYTDRAYSMNKVLVSLLGGGPRVVVSTAALHARVRGSVPGLGGLKETKMFLPHPRVKVSIVGSLRDREVACSASDRQGSNFESCVWRTVSSQSSHHPQEVLLAQFSLYVHKGGLKPDSFHFVSLLIHWMSALFSSTAHLIIRQCWTSGWSLSRKFRDQTYLQRSINNMRSVPDFPNCHISLLMSDVSVKAISPQEIESLPLFSTDY